MKISLVNVKTVQMLPLCPATRNQNATKRPVINKQSPKGDFFNAQSSIYEFH